MPNILVVCTANICRSPVGEAILRDRLQKRGLESWTVSSAGTWAQIRRGAARYSVQLMAEIGLDIRQHQAQMVEKHHLEEADLVLCMESGHAEALRAEFSPHESKIYLFSQMIGQRYSISDPYGEAIGSYRQMVTELTNIIDKGLDKIVALAKTGGKT